MLLQRKPLPHPPQNRTGCRMTLHFFFIVPAWHKLFRHSERGPLSQSDKHVRTRSLTSMIIKVTEPWWSQNHYCPLVLVFKQQGAKKKWIYRITTGFVTKNQAEFTAVYCIKQASTRSNCAISRSTLSSKMKGYLTSTSQYQLTRLEAVSGKCPWFESTTPLTSWQES